MKKLAAYFLILLPGLAFGQLFPKVPDFRGNLRKVAEKKYGRVVDQADQPDGRYKPAVFSGWTFTYVFDSSSRIVKRTEVFKGETDSEKQYSYKVDGFLQVVRQTEICHASKDDGDFLEMRKIPNSMGQISEVEYVSFDASTGKTSLYMVENNPKYTGGKLSDFKRVLFNDNGDTTGVEDCKLIYNSSGKLKEIRREDVESGFTTVISLRYNRRGWVDRYSVDLMAELQEAGKKQIQNIYYKYDRHGNWKKKYREVGAKKQLEAKRKNKYW